MPQPTVAHCTYARASHNLGGPLLRCPMAPAGPGHLCHAWRLPALQKETPCSPLLGNRKQWPGKAQSLRSHCSPAEPQCPVGLFQKNHLNHLNQSPFVPLVSLVPGMAGLQLPWQPCAHTHTLETASHRPRAHCHLQPHLLQRVRKRPEPR